MPFTCLSTIHSVRVLLAVAFLLLVSPAAAWDEHHLVTRASLSNLPSLQSQPVPYTAFESLLRDLGFSSARQFNESIQIRKEYEFLPTMGEAAGAEVPVLDVLAAYSDEPDWGMDKEIFGQYPEVWRSEYARMGGREGKPSQAFRHMYWPEFSWRMPLRTLKSPVAKLFSPMGLAPDRATLFMDLSRKARAAGHPYWSVRFVANALHYLEDMAQPFHASQTPTKRFLLLPLLDRDHGNGTQNYVLQVQNIVAYYHYSFENYVSRQMREYYAGENNAAGKQFVEALAGDSSTSVEPSWAEPMPGGAGIAERVTGMAHASVRDSARAARTSMDFFPPIQERFDTFDPERSVGEDRWWRETLRNSAVDSEARREYFGVVQEMFSRLGGAVRSVVGAEVVEPRLLPLPEVR